MPFSSSVFIPTLHYVEIIELWKLFSYKIMFVSDELFTCCFFYRQFKRFALCNWKHSSDVPLRRLVRHMKLSTTGNMYADVDDFPAPFKTSLLPFQHIKMRNSLSFPKKEFTAQPYDRITVTRIALKTFSRNNYAVYFIGQQPRNVAWHANTQLTLSRIFCSFHVCLIYISLLR